MEPYQQKYVQLNSNPSSASTGLIIPPPQRRNIPRYNSHHHSKGNGCLKCICCCFCFWIVLIILLVGSALFLYTYLQPQVPQYNVHNFQVHAFDLQKDFSLYTEFLVTVKANNPNPHIGMIYGKSSSVVVAYSDSVLCSGKLPAFHQPYENVTIMDIVLTGKSEFGSGLQQALMENRNTGRIPLLVMVKAPVSVVLQDFPLKEIVVLVNCSLVIDNLVPNKQVKILNTTYTYDVGIVM